MSISKKPGRTFDAVMNRHRVLVIAGGVSTAFGLLVAAYVGYEWFVDGVSHEILTIVAAVAVLFGVQVLVLSSLSSMLIRLHEELVQQLGD